MEIDAEYNQAFRTKSYLDIIMKLQEDDQNPILNENNKNCHPLIREYINACNDAFGILKTLLKNIRENSIEDLHAVLFSRQELNDIHVRNCGLFEKLTAAKSACFRREKLRRIILWCFRATGDTVGTQMDVASRGVFIMINDLDTIGVLVKRVREESEHWVKMTEVCGRLNGDVIRELRNEFRKREPAFRENVSELERLAYLCLNTIERGRRLAMEAI